MLGRSLPLLEARMAGAPVSFLRVANLDEIPTDRGLHIRVGGIEIGLYRVGEAIHAMEDACPHAGFPLSRGRLEGCVVTCAAHGLPFDIRTGFNPTNADGFPLYCFAVRVTGNDVELNLDDRTNDSGRNRTPSRADPKSRNRG